MRTLRYAVAAVALAFLTSCAHDLRVINAGDYENRTLLSLEHAVTVGIIPSTSNIYEDRFVKEIATQLTKYRAEAFLPYSEGSRRAVDVIANVNVTSEYSGSGWNFPVEFPGFLIWAPAWHGYHYWNHYDVTVLLTDAKTHAAIDSFAMPIDLRIRHSDINRTWTEISWFEVGFIAFVSGFVFIGYDSQVSGLTMDKVGAQLGDYVAQEIVRRIDSFGVGGVGAAFGR